MEQPSKKPYTRDRATWALFAALFGFGFLNSVLGPALPYLRSVEHVSYLVGSLHQVAFAVGGGLAGLLAVRLRMPVRRTVVIGTGLAGADAAGLALGYGSTALVTIGAAFLVSLLGTSALVRLWAALADAHGPRRPVAMAEGEVSVSLAGMATPLLIGGLASTRLGWRFGFVVGALLVAVGIVAVAVVRLPPPLPGRTADASPQRAPGRRFLLPTTLVVVFAVVGLEFSLSFWSASYLDDGVGIDRGAAVAMVSGLYAANLAGRLLVSVLARRIAAPVLLAGSLALCLMGLPVLLVATSAAAAAVGLAVVGIGIGALFPLTSSLHVAASARTADGAMGQVMIVASAGQIVGPWLVGVIAQSQGLRLGLLVLPALVLLAGAALVRHVRRR